MDPNLEKALGSIARWVLNLAVPFFVSSGIWTPEDATTYVAAGGLALVSLVWSLWEKYKSRLEFVTALSTGPTTEAKIEQMVSAGDTPAVTTPKHAIPVLPTTRTFKVDG